MKVEQRAERRQRELKRGRGGDRGAGGRVGDGGGGDAGERKVGEASDGGRRRAEYSAAASRLADSGFSC